MRQQTCGIPYLSMYLNVSMPLKNQLLLQQKELMED